MRAHVPTEVRVRVAGKSFKPNFSAFQFSALGWLFVLLWFAGRASAVQHPVPLDPKADSSTCLACHEDKTKGKSVHSAIAMGCTSCHEIRVNKDITRVKLITTTPQSLCITCHAEKDAAKLKGTVHPPAVRDCIKCHDPHVSENKNQLLKPPTGDKGTNLCLDCHNQGVNVPEKGSRHAALDMGCLRHCCNRRHADVFIQGAHLLQQHSISIENDLSAVGGNQYGRISLVGHAPS